MAASLWSSLQRLSQPQTCLRQRHVRQPRPGGGFGVPEASPALNAAISSSTERVRHTAAFESLTLSAATNIPGVDFTSITISGPDETLQTVAATDPLAARTDQLQYELREGPCYAAVNEDRFVLVNDLAGASDFPRYAPRAVELGVRAQAAIQLTSPGQRAGLNLYSRTADAFGHSTIQVASCSPRRQPPSSTTRSRWSSSARPSTPAPTSGRR